MYIIKLANNTNGYCSTIVDRHDDVYLAIKRAMRLHKLINFLHVLNVKNGNQLKVVNVIDDDNDDIILTLKIDKYDGEEDE